MNQPIRLEPYQVEGVNFLCDSRYPNRLLADDMGLGKTIQAAAACAQLGARRILVLCPATVKKHWGEHFRLLGYHHIGINTLNTPISIWNYDHISRGASVRHHFIETFRNYVERIGPYDVLILDEAHLLADEESSRTRRILNPAAGIWQYARRVFALTGTPLKHSPADLYPLLCALWKHALVDCPTYSQFVDKFCEYHYEGQNLVIDGARNLPELRRRLEGFMLRRTNVGAQTGVTLRKITLPVDLRGIEAEQTNHISARRRSASSKTPFILDAIGKLVEHHGNLVIFAHHADVMRQIAARYPISAIIKGGQGHQQRQQAIESFIKGQRKLIVIQIRAGGTGLDGLQKVCSTAMFLEDDWTPSQLEQAKARLNRRGQTKPVTYYFVAAENSSIESRMQEVLYLKRNIIEEFMDADTGN